MIASRKHQDCIYRCCLQSLPNFNWFAQQEYFFFCKTLFDLLCYLIFISSKIKSKVLYIICNLRSCEFNVFLISQACKVRIKVDFFKNKDLFLD